MVKNKLITGLLLLLTFILIRCLAGEGYAANSLGSNTIYIDPLFGGKENGPVLAGKILSKNLTLDTALKLRESLRKKDIAAELTRDGDYFVALEERLSRAKLKNSYVYISLGVSQKNESCITVLYPPQEKMIHDRQNTETYSDLEALKKSKGKTFIHMAREAVVKDSSLLAIKIFKNMNKESVPICSGSALSIEPRYVYEYILNNTHCPVVIIDFGISNLNSGSSYIFNEKY